MLKGSILQYFQPSLSYHLSLRSLFCLFLSGHFTLVLLYYYRAFEQAGLLCKEKKDMDSAVQFMERASLMFQEHGTPDTAALCLEKAAK